jgi:hypothetical protein
VLSEARDLSVRNRTGRLTPVEKKVIPQPLATEICFPSMI